MSLWIKFKLWIAYKWGLNTLLKRPDIILQGLLKRYSNEDFANWARQLDWFMRSKVGLKHWNPVAKALKERLQHFVDNIYGGQSG